MSQRKEILINLIAFVVAGVFIDGVLGLLKILSGPGVESSNPPVNGIDKTGTAVLANSVRERISQGEKMLFKKEESGTDHPELQAAKQKVVRAMAAVNYQQAAQYFEKAIEKYRNAPEP